jgi:hypothetical protein
MHANDLANQTSFWLKQEFTIAATFLKMVVTFSSLSASFFKMQQSDSLACVACSALALSAG